MVVQIEGTFVTLRSYFCIRVMPFPQTRPEVSSNLEYFFASSDFLLRKNLQKRKTLLDAYTSGHHYLDTERVSCLMNTHWNTLSSNRPSSTSNSTFPGLGFEPQTWKTWKLKWNWNCHSTLWRKRGKAPYDFLLFNTVFQWVLIRQLPLSASR